MNASVFCAIDMGSNTIKVSVWHLHSPPTPLFTHRFPVRLGRGVFETGEIDPERVEKTLEAMRDVHTWAHREGDPVFRAVATAAMRAARNAPTLIAQVREQTGIEIEVIDTDREGELTSTGMLWSLQPEGAGRYAVIDIGGGSGEITLLDAEGDTITSFRSVSLPIGAVRLTDHHLPSNPPTSAEMKSLQTHMRETLAVIRDGDFEGTLIGCGGTMMSLGQMLHGEGEITPRLTLAEIESLLEIMTPMTATERADQYPIDHQRAEVIVAGAIALVETIRALGADAIRVSAGGNREGLLAEHLRWLDQST